MDEVLIQQTIARYSEAISRGAWDEAVATYLPDAVWDIPVYGQSHRGHAEIRAAMAAFTTGWDYAAQLAGIPVIVVGGDTATARTVVRELARPSGGDQVFEMVGTYVDRLVRGPDGWRFSHRLIEPRGMHTYTVADLNS